ncbi:hypothetical protein PXD04_10430 [Methanosphaera sp. ISO3-F5]|uniref:hypothetical protein n=1 Tax=Methanosphaera sp. ISO3-F5 TaxID=1452353 RepID=UPI002B25B6F6|nr:hypothetical protein [Methanosphaera sp. ISO3-F5]WQH64107.1 hypothetical protein PXD04_10430 [Methanosphaera sp. ISO3-F5]
MTVQYPNKLNKKRKVYFTMDNTSNKNSTIRNTVITKLRNAGINVVSRPEGKEIGPNCYSRTFRDLEEDGIKDIILIGLVNGVDPTNLREVSFTNYDWQGTRFRNLGNDVIFAAFYDSCDFTRPDGTCYNKVKMRSPTTDVPTGGYFYNLKKFCEDNKIYAVNQSSNQHRNPERADYTGELIAQRIIELFDDGTGNTNTNDNNTDTNIKNPDPENPTITPATNTTTTNTDGTTKTITTRTITQTYTTPHYEKVIRAKTDRNGAFHILPELPYKGEYTATMKFAGDKEHSSSTKTIHIYNYSDSSQVFKERLIQTKITTSYSDGTSHTDTNGTTPDNKHVKRVITTETYNNGKLTKTEKRTVFVDNIIREAPETNTNTTTTTTTTTPTDPTVNPSPTPLPNTPTPVTNVEKGHPFHKVIPPVNGVPQIAAMQIGDKNFVFVDTNRSYNLTYAQFRAVYDRDSQTMQFNNYKLSNYTAFESEDTNTWNVCERQQWNSVVESIHFYKVNHRRGEWPQSYVIDFQNKRTKCGDTWVEWKNSSGKTTIWFCADKQNGEYDCGPTSLSVCTQVLMHYHPEVDLPTRSPGQLRDMFNERGFSAHNKGGMSTALSELDAGRPCIWHIDFHYIALTMRSKHNQQILVANSAGDRTTSKYTYYGKLMTGWNPYTNLNGSATGAHTFVKLNWKITEEWKQKINTFFKSMGGAWERPFADEGIRKGTGNG